MVDTWPSELVMTVCVPGVAVAVGVTVVTCPFELVMTVVAPELPDVLVAGVAVDTWPSL